MTPPTVEYWRVWSDSADRWDMDGNHASEFESIESAQREASAKNALTYSRHTDWRPVRVRETVVEPGTPSISGTLDYLFGLDTIPVDNPPRILVVSEDERRMAIDADRVVKAMKLLGWSHGAVSSGVDAGGRYVATVEL